MRPSSGVTIVDGVGIAYVEDGDDLAIIGMDPATGRRLWSHPASPSAWTPGVGLSPDIVAGKVVYLVDASSSRFDDVRARVVVADPRTGRTIARSSGSYSVRSHPAPCGPDVCVTATASTGDTTVRVSLGTKATTTTADAGSGASGETIGAGMTRSTGSSIHRVVDGKVVWSLDLQRLLGKGYSTDYGWNFQPIGDTIVTTVHNGSHSDLSDLRIDMAKAVTIALSAKDGHLVWRADGVDTLCFSGEQPDPTTHRMIGCRWSSGRYTRSFLEGTATRLAIDTRTGKTMWTGPLGRINDADMDVIRVRHGLVVNTMGGGAGFDPATGDSVPADVPGFRTDLAKAQIGHGGVFSKSDVYIPTVGTTSVESAAWPLIDGIGTQHGGLRIVSEPNRIVAYAAP